MSGKSRDIKVMQEITEEFFNNCTAKGYDPKISKEVWRQMESFAGYSFCKAHSASFAVESYQSLFLKTYYPMEFMVAVLNNYGGFYNRSVYINEARKAGANINLPCVNNSSLQANIQGGDIYLGFDCLHNLQKELAVVIPHEREQNGPFSSLHNFILRIGMSLDQIIILVRAGAFRFTNLSKKALLWEAHLLLSQVKKFETAPLFNCEENKHPVLPSFETGVIEDLYDEIELMGFPVSGSFFDMVRTEFRGDAKASNLTTFAGQTVRLLGEFVCDKVVYTKRNEYMKFGSFLDEEGNFFDTVHFPPSLRKYPPKGAGIYLILGKVVLDFEYPAIEVEKIARLPVHPDPRSI